MQLRIDKMANKDAIGMGMMTGVLPRCLTTGEDTRNLRHFACRDDGMILKLVALMMMMMMMILLFENNPLLTQR